MNELIDRDLCRPPENALTGRERMYSGRAVIGREGTMTRRKNQLILFFGRCLV